MLLGDVLADAHHRLAAIRRWAGGVLGLVPVLDASQVLGQHLASRLALGLLVGRRRRCLAALALQGQQLRLQAGLVFGERLLEHLALLGVHAFGLGSELSLWGNRNMPGLPRQRWLCTMRACSICRDSTHKTSKV